MEACGMLDKDGTTGADEEVEYASTGTGTGAESVAAFSNALTPCWPVCSGAVKKGTAGAGGAVAAGTSPNRTCHQHFELVPLAVLRRGRMSVQYRQERYRRIQRSRPF